MNPHRPLTTGVRVYSASADAAYSRKMSTNVRFIKKKSEVMIVPSLQAVGKTAPNARHFGDSLKTLFRWKDSIYKLVWRHMLIYYLLYLTLTLIYEFLLDKTGRKYFDVLVKYFSRSATTFNLMIMLGFFTSTTLQRLFTMQTSIPGTAKVTSLFVMSLKPDLPEGSIIVHQYARWAVLSWILAIRSVSKPLRKLFPSMISLQIKGILLERERVILERVETEGNTTPRPLVVIDWMLLLLKECSTYGRYNNKSCYHKNVEVLMVFKKSCGNIIKFATRNIPHALIQAVIIAVYYFGLVTMMARDLSYPHTSLPSINQTIDTSDGQLDDEPAIVKTIFSYFPLMPFMQFFIFFAWLTFGRMAVNPFGDDTTDIDLQNLFQSHIEDYLRLTTLYESKLEDVFVDLPQKRFNEVAAATKDATEEKEKHLPKVASSPDFAVFSISSSNEIKNKEPKLETCVSIESGNEEDDQSTSFLDENMAFPKLQRKVPHWKGVKR